MTTLKDGVKRKESFNKKGDNDYYYITFKEDGEANFWSAPVDPAMDIKMYVYNNDTKERLETEHNRKKDNRNVLIPKLSVKAGIEYKIRLRHYGGPEGDYYVKAKNYPKKSSKKFNLGISSISANKSEPFTVGEEVKFTVKVKNYRGTYSPKYRVAVYDKSGEELDYDREPSIKKSDNASLDVTINKAGDHRLKFAIEPRESGWTETDDDNNVKYRTYTWKKDAGTGNDSKLSWKKVKNVIIWQKPKTLPVYVRSDMSDSFYNAVNEINNLGGVVVSSGGKRALSDVGRSGTSKTSLHYTGRAVDLYVYAGLQNPDRDKYIVVKSGGTETRPRWTLYCKTENTSVPKKILKAATYKRNIGISEKEIEGRFINLTGIFKKHGWDSISARSNWKTNYMSCEWWHFENVGGLEKNKTTFKSQLLRLYTEDQINSYFTGDRKKYLSYKWNGSSFKK